ncbi:hypothetical protein FACS1894111_05740 [Clostridia bacterium]|nr:hypothetical protein FACS1894111_05740 [Clostridia bacterium]
MTPIILLERLKEFLQENTKDIILSVRPVKNKTLPQTPRTRGNRTAEEETEAEQVRNRAAEVHLMRLPDKDAEENRIPYILLQLITGTDTQEPGQQEDSETKVRIIIATYSENDSEGALDVLNLISRIRIALLKAGEVGQQFLLRKPLEYLVYPDDTRPYFFGEIMSIWEMPTIKREVNLYYDE